ncbi:helix-turn-helix transcriptional regulator [Paenibacillus silvisoli]|uniref:helix-turn-helix transcriptional regulator n=1 Tax=Paenibacillus silvisoli TaxID=3110539 RepID=UPI00280639E4|nr:AraC family transcriptional regulator [Paenibacillus silvisoli]
MTLELEVIKSCEIILPHGSVKYQFENQIIVLLVTQGQLKVEWFKNKINIQQNQFIIGNDIKLSNLSNNTAMIRGFIFADNGLYVEKGRSPLIIKPDDSNAVDRLIASMELCMSEKNECNWTSLKTIASKLTDLISGSEVTCAQVSSNDYVPLTGTIDQRLILINRYIRRNYSQPLSLHSLAELVQCSPGYLSNTYSKVFNISPMKYLQKIRLSRAMELLLETTLPIREIANSIGYVSNSQFTDFFKKSLGVTPKAYRIAHQNKLAKARFLTNA